ncbi:twin-arginine translocase subunit TatC [Methylobacillus flagellatus]|uniref:Sec-independent protein translocase protein TatC n=1 Tax=Methylobacillus flagellatus (strain ATCC 51484 / DSM 6875 / VKM B-1610 / KT) TaxID=265072 RepID=Q1H3X3_METFK|nr:twin-arginine translocase subunit TatC [Methylobacillus flagellatus]ABE48814.1 Sec-independent protein translocase TatC [Methylobacillus flagellatus KT]
MEQDGFLSHFYELRTRFIRIIAGMLVPLLAILPFANELHGFFVTPLLNQLPAGGQMIATSVTSPFLIPLKIAFYVAVAVSLPHTLYQVWKFFQPGLYPKEKLISVLGVVSSVILFVIGACFAFYLVIPVVIKFIVGTAPEGVAVMTEIGSYLDFLVSIMLAFGISFQTPIIVVAIAALGIVELKTLREIRGYVVVGAFVVGAIFTPPDIISQFMLAIPLWLLYELGVFIAMLVVARRAAVPALPDA